MTRRAALWLAPALLAACWTGGPSAGGAAEPALSGDPSAGGAVSTDAAGCPTRLVGMVIDAATQAPLAGATVVVETAAGSVATELTDARGRFETAAVRPPARLAIYHGAHTAAHALSACQPPLRLGVRLSAP